jgi:hypothetical protein
MKSQKKPIPNKFHLHIQTKYRVIIQENKKHYKRCRDKLKANKEIREI